MHARGRLGYVALWTWLGAGLSMLVHGLVASGARAQADLPRPRQSYEIHATLDPEAHLVRGTQTLRFTHEASAPLTSLTFHLYLNAFRDRQSVFMREGGESLRGAALTVPGGIDVLELRDERGDDLLVRATTQGGAPGDATQLFVPLPTPMAPGRAHTLHLRFVARLPKLVARSGFAGDFHMLAQWFPKLAKLEADGRFVSFPYHGAGEFYADFASYVVSLRVPQRFVVGGSGVRTRSIEHDDGSRTDDFEAHAVHDVAFAAYPELVRYEARHRDVELELLAPRGYAMAARRQLHVLRAALADFEPRFGPYPYPKLTVIVPPREAFAAGGMEYPTLFTSGGPWFAAPHASPDVLHDTVVVHELAHQWFGALFASNEVAEPWLDEGLAEWATLDFLDRYYTRRGSLFAFLAGTSPVFRIANELLVRGGPAPSSLLPAYRYHASELARAIYLRPALVLHALEREHGRSKLDRALASYARTARFGHPTRATFLTAFDAAYARDLGRRKLEPALRGDKALRPRAQVSPPSLFADLLLLAQALVRGAGP